jgi:hypothetical protein
LAARPSPRKYGFSDDIEAWMQQRKAEVGQFVRDAEAAGRRAWNEATRAGQDALGRTQSELAALGAPQLRRKQNGATVPVQPAKPAGGSWLDRSSAAKVAGGSVAQMAGNGVGLGRGVLHSAEGVGQGVNFATRLPNPFDALVNGPANSAWGQLVNAANGTAGYVEKGIAHPASVASDLQKLGHQLYVNTVPSATPTAGTFGGEMARNFRLGANQGELGWDMGSLLFGGAASKALRGLGARAEASGPAKFVAQGFSPAQADYLAAPYEGMGHHFVQRWAAKAIGLPSGLTDSVFNVLKPTRISRGDFYGLHYGVDPHFESANLPKAVGGGTWIGEDLGLQKYGPWASLWHGSPAPLNTVVGTAAVNNAANFDPDERGH